MIWPGFMTEPARGRLAPCLLIMAKAPMMGISKTRLARAIGPVEAWRVNRQLHRITLAAATGGPWRCVIAAAPARAVARALPGLWPANVPRFAQCAGGLTRRLLHAADRFGPVLGAAPAADFAFIGTDCPGITPARIADGFRALRRADFAFGPTPDGGFWFMGVRAAARSRLRRAFAGIRWSSAHTLSDITANLGPEARIARIVTLADVDDGEDYRRWRAGRPANSETS